MSYENPVKGRGLQLTKYLSKPSVPSQASKALDALTGLYFARYGKERKTFKLYDGGLGNELFPFLKRMAKRFPNNKKIIQALKDSIKDKKLTKGFYSPGLLFETLEGFFSKDKEVRVTDPHFVAAKQRLIEQIVPEVPLKPRVIKRGMNVRKNLTVLNTSAGFMNYGKKKKHVVKYMINSGLELKRLIASGVSHYKIWTPPYVALTRSQLGTMGENLEYKAPVDDNGNYKYKGRLVWCQDAAMTLFESQYARPLINYLAKAWPNIAMGKSPEYIRDQMVRISDECLEWFSSDFSKYDSTIPAQLIREAFDIVKMCFDEEYHRELDFICVKFIEAEILMPDMEIYSVKKGVKSGSYFTQVIGSMVNALMLFTFLEHRYGKYQENKYGDKKDVYGNTIDNVFKLADGRYMYSILGDDNGFGLKDNLEFAAFAKYLKRTFGVIINVDKSTKGVHGEPIEYLKRGWTPFGETRDCADLMINMMHPERARTYENYGPWHIIFGYYLTYRKSMEEMGFSLTLIVSKMKASPHGIEALYEVSREELPGALANIKYSNFEMYQDMINQAIVIAESDYVDRWEDVA